MIGFFLAFCFTIPFLFIHTSKITHLFTIKAVIMPAAGLGIVIWATNKNGGVSSGNLQASAEATPTSVLAWGIVAQFNAVMGANSALLVTVPDLARYSKTKNAQFWGQLIALPIAQTLCASFGIITTVSTPFGPRLLADNNSRPCSICTGQLIGTHTIYSTAYSIRGTRPQRGQECSSLPQSSHSLP